MRRECQKRPGALADCRSRYQSRPHCFAIQPLPAARRGNLRWAQFLAHSATSSTRFAIPSCRRRCLRSFGGSEWRAKVIIASHCRITDKLRLRPPSLSGIENGAPIFLYHIKHFYSASCAAQSLTALIPSYCFGPFSLGCEASRMFGARSLLPMTPSIIAPTSRAASRLIVRQVT